MSIYSVQKPRPYYFYCGIIYAVQSKFKNCKSHTFFYCKNTINHTTSKAFFKDIVLRDCNLLGHIQTQKQNIISKLFILLELKSKNSFNFDDKQF